MAARAGTGQILGELGVWLALGALAYGLSFEFADQPGTYLWGATSWPRGVVVLLVLGALAQAGMRLRARATEPAAPPPAAAADSLKPLAAKRLAFVANFALPLVYVFALPHTGFYVVTPFFLAAYLALLGERRPKVLILAPLVIFALINIVFTKLFYVALPTGNWPGFYDISNWFLVTVR